MLEPIGDNAFASLHIFQESTGYSGVHPCWAADTDCDGLDELVMCFHPYYRTWYLDEDRAVFVEGCSWYNDDAMPYWSSLDVDQNGVPEWASTTTHALFRSLPDLDCVYCDSVGYCATLKPCACACSGDPVCDGQATVLDVVAAVDVAFRDAIPPPDPFRQCPSIMTDVDCSGLTNVLDVVHIVNVAFRNGDPAAEFCDPCP